EGHVELAVTAGEQTPEGVALWFGVTDTGIGIPLDKQHLLFKRFSQVDASARREFGGTGLGLAISDRLARLMAGVIEVESAPETGSTFRLRLHLPVAGPETLRAAPDMAEAQTAVRGRILLVEDLEVNRELGTFI